MKKEVFEEMIFKVSFTAKDIAIMTGLKRSRVSQIMKECRLNYGGEIPFRKNAITSKSYWLREGTTREELIKLFQIYNQEEEIKNG